MIAFSIWVWLTPLESYVGLAFAFSILVFANGVSHIYFSISNRQNLEGFRCLVVIHCGFLANV